MKNAPNIKPESSRKPVFTVGTWLGAARRRLKAEGIPTSDLDASLLIGDLLGKNRAWILAHPEYELTAGQVGALRKKVDRRTKHEPMAYIRQKVEFYGREFFVNKNVLVPRSESETMIAMAVELATTGLGARANAVSGTPSYLHEGMKAYGKNTPAYVNTQAPCFAVADIGTGSGALGITLALELSTVMKVPKKLILCDIDPLCLKVALENSQTYGLESDVIQSDLIPDPGQAGRYHIILANLPYVPDSHTINQAAMSEPKHAIFGGEDGLDLYRRMFEQLDAARPDWQPQFVLTESLPFQHATLAKIAASHGFTLLKTDDFIQAFTPAKKAMQ